MKSLTFRVRIEEDPFEDGRMAYRAYIPSLEHKGASSWGYTVEEAMKNIHEVVQMVVESLSVRGEPLPTKSTEDIQISPAPQVTVTLAS